MRKLCTYPSPKARIENGIMEIIRDAKILTLHYFEINVNLFEWEVGTFNYFIYAFILIQLNPFYATFSKKINWKLRAIVWDCNGIFISFAFYGLASMKFFRIFEMCVVENFGRSCTFIQFFTRWCCEYWRIAIEWAEQNKFEWE